MTQQMTTASYQLTAAEIALARQLHKEIEANEARNRARWAAERTARPCPTCADVHWCTVCGTSIVEHAYVDLRTAYAGQIRCCSCALASDEEHYGEQVDAYHMGELPSLFVLLHH